MQAPWHGNPTDTCNPVDEARDFNHSVIRLRRVHLTKLESPVLSQRYPKELQPGVQRAMSLSFATNEVLSLITHDPLNEYDIPAPRR